MSSLYTEGPNSQVNTLEERIQKNPAVAGLPTGGYVVVWESEAPHPLYEYNGAIRGQLFDISGSKIGDEFTIGENADYYHRNPTVTALQNGNFVVIWDALGSNEGDVLGQIYSPDGLKVGAEFIVNSSTEREQVGPSVLALSNGGFLVTWASDPPDGGSYVGLAQTFNSSGEKVGGEVEIGSNSPNMIELQNGNLMIVWGAWNGSQQSDIFGRIYNDELLPLGQEFTINSYTEGRQIVANVASLGPNLIVTWSSLDQDGSEYGVYAQRIDADGQPIGEEFLVNTKTIGSQINSDVRALSDGSVVVTWSTDGSVISGQRIGPDGSFIGDEFELSRSGQENHQDPTFTVLSGDKLLFSWVDGEIFARLLEPVEPPEILKTTAEIFYEEGKLAFIAQLALAAYHLEPHEIVAERVNNEKLFSELAFNGGSTANSLGYDALEENLKLLTAEDLPTLELSESNIPNSFLKNGISNGIYTNENAAALVARSSDAVFIAFRGTNDNEGQAGLRLNGDPNPDTPDESHWIGKEDHFDLFAPLLGALDIYIQEEGITQVYVTGHSLGASMVEKFMKDNPGIKFEAITFANPGYGPGLHGGDSRMSDFLIRNDPIGGVQAISEIEGKQIEIFHNLAEGDYLHQMQIYSNYMGYLEENDIDLQQLQAWSTDRIYAYASFEEPDIGTMAIGLNDDSITGNSTNDLILGGSGNDTIDAGYGANVIFGGSGNDFFHAESGTNEMDGGAGVDTLSYANETGGSGLFITLNNGQVTDTFGTMDTALNFENVVGSDYDDVISANALDNMLTGFGGNDTIYGQQGDDILNGGSGNDTLSGGADSDRIYAGNGNDMVLGAGGDDSLLYGGPNDDIISAGGGNDTDVYGGSGEDVVLGSSGNDELYGGNDQDIVSGGTGIDFVSGGDGIDEVFGAQGNDTLYGGNENDTVSGGENDDFVSGEAGDDLVLGASGNDTLDGGKGDDFLSAGTGEDVFIFGQGYQADTGVGFEDNIDTVRFDDNLWAGTLTAQDIINTYGTQLSPGTVQFDFGSGDIITFTNSAGLTLQSLLDDIEIF